jgi:hypothetical protein
LYSMRSKQWCRTPGQSRCACSALGSSCCCQVAAGSEEHTNPPDAPA